MSYDLQKGGLGKRLSAFLFDGILLATLAVGIAFLLSSLLNYDSYTGTLNACYEKYEQQYGVTFGITQEQFEQMPEAEKKNFEEASNAIAADPEAVRAYNMMVNLAMIILTGGVLVSFLLLEFLVPLKFGNGQTLGKKIFGLAVMRNDGVKINTITLFVRTVLGKFTIETMAPIMIVILIFVGSLGILGTILLGLLLLLQIILMIASRTNAVIHDKLANTVVVDMASQLIFATELELIAYKQQKQAEKAAQQKY